MKIFDAFGFGKLNRFVEMQVSRQSESVVISLAWRVICKQFILLPRDTTTSLQHMCTPEKFRLHIRNTIESRLDLPAASFGLYSLLTQSANSMKHSRRSLVLLVSVSLSLHFCMCTSRKSLSDPNAVSQFLERELSIRLVPRYFGT
jgi:hypothetical protein